MLNAKPPMWTLDEASELVRDLNTAVRAFDFHIAIGGGVVNKKSSEKDLDLYVLPVYKKSKGYDWFTLDTVLNTFLGSATSMRAQSTEEHEEGHCFRAERIYRMPGGKRIDLFIVDPAI